MLSYDVPLVVFPETIKKMKRKMFMKKRYPKGLKKC